MNRTRKKGQSRHHAMHHFHAIKLIILLFHELYLEKRANHSIHRGCIIDIVLMDTLLFQFLKNLTRPRDYMVT